MSFLQTINPSTEEVCGRYPLMSKEQIELIIHDMQEVQCAWSKEAIATRTACLKKLAKLLLETKEESARLMTEEMGKPLSQALAEIEKCKNLCDYYADQAEAFLRPEMIKTEHYKTYRSFQPLGIIFAIMPWNFPFWQVMRFAVPNFMVGNAGLLKHAPNSTGTALRIEALIEEAGFPKNLFRSLVMDVQFAADIIADRRIAGVTLTGSNQAGQIVAAQAGAALKKVVLELGGSDPYIVLEDADLELAASQAVLSRLSNAGQVCIAAKRIIVVEKVKAAFEALVLKKSQAYVMGNPLDKKTLLGPMARDDLRKKLHDQVQRSIQAGAHCLLGGEEPKGRGYYYPATVLTDITEDSPAFHEELFGPVIGITQVKTEHEALRLANQTEFGLAGAIFTRDLAKGEAIARDVLQAGTCAVNTLIASDPRLPFGGIKQSGYGRELSLEGMREFVNVKTVVVSKGK
jgi:succinate-semialdehyde dehydrogenase/glutarate-semialdehyde dehydrogenase